MDKPSTPQSVPPTTDSPSPRPSRGKERLLSLDALRGFDMFWIVGGSRLFEPLYALTGWQLWKTIAKQMHHSRWHGFTAIDLIFPLFVFISGVALGLGGDPTQWDRSQRLKKYRHALWRLLLLIFLGVIYNRAHGWGDFQHWANPRYASVLSRIAIAWFICAMIVWHITLRWQIVTAIVILLGYWALQAACGDFTPKGCVNAWVDQRFLPGLKLGGVMDPEGLLSNIPAVVNAMLGVFAAKWLKYNIRLSKKTSLLAGAGILLLAIGWLWNEILPVNKKLWTSSYVLVTGGWSCLLLALFYLIIDGWKIRPIGRLMAVFGANAILVYFAFAMIDWRYTSDHLFGGFIQLAPSPWQPLLQAVGVLAIQWLILAWLYRRRIFIRI